MYVWVDALTNYLTGLGFPEETPAMAMWWPADIHLIGKDIVRFHAVYWPAFLMSAGVAVPRKVYGHGSCYIAARRCRNRLAMWLIQLNFAERFGVDSLRYFLMRDVSFGQDGSWSAEAIVTRCNAELANSFGNLAQRVLSMIFKNLDGELVTEFQETDADRALFDAVRRARPACGTGSRHLRSAMVWRRGCLPYLPAINTWMNKRRWTLRKTDARAWQRF